MICRLPAVPASAVDVLGENSKPVTAIGDVLNAGTFTFSPPSAKPTWYVPAGTSVFGSIPVISRGLGPAGTMTSSPL